jgi:hypothetical protein
MTVITDTMTSSIRDISVMADEKLAPVVLALNRQLFFTDVPCGAMKIRDCHSTELVNDDDDLPRGVARFCGGLERVFCFSDLKDIEQSDLKRLRSMQSIGDKHIVVGSGTKKGTPVVETVDTESCSDDDSVDIQPAVEKPEPLAEAGVAETKPVAEAKLEPNEEAEDKKKDQVKENEPIVRETLVTYPPKQTETEVLPPANTLQASTNKVNAGKPSNTLQAARALKKEKQEALKKERQAKQAAAKEAKLNKQKAKKEARKTNRSWALFPRPKANP